MSASCATEAILARWDRAAPWRATSRPPGSSKRLGAGAARVTVAFSGASSGGWGQDGYLKDLNVTDEIKAARFDLSRDINSFISKIDVGVNYNERTKTRNSDEWFLDLPGGKTSSATEVLCYGTAVVIEPET